MCLQGAQVSRPEETADLHIWHFQPRFLNAFIRQALMLFAVAAVKKDGCRIVGPSAALELTIHIFDISPDGSWTISRFRGIPTCHDRGMVVVQPFFDQLAHIVSSIYVGRPCEQRDGGVRGKAKHCRRYLSIHIAGRLNGLWKMADHSMSVPKFKRSLTQMLVTFLFRNQCSRDSVGITGAYVINASVQLIPSSRRRAYPGSKCWFIQSFDSTLMRGNLLRADARR